jgi:MYXO-CTERM domain-containing protein
MGMPVMPGYQLGGAPSYMQSIPFAPDIVVIGAWGKHDTEIANSLWQGMLDPVQFKTDYERMVTTYLNLPNKPRVIVSTPVPIPKGTPVGPTTMVILPVVKDTAAKFGLEVVDLYPRFLNHPELFKDDTHVTDEGGLETMADAEYVVIKGKTPPPPPRDGGPVDMDANGTGSGGGSVATGAGGSGGTATGSGGAAGAGVGTGGNPTSTTGSTTDGVGGAVGSSSVGAGGTAAGHNITNEQGGCSCRVGSNADRHNAWGTLFAAAFAALALRMGRRRTSAK